MGDSAKQYEYVLILSNFYAKIWAVLKLEYSNMTE